MTTERKNEPAATVIAAAVVALILLPAAGFMLGLAVGAFHIGFDLLT